MSSECSALYSDFSLIVHILSFPPYTYIHHFIALYHCAGLELIHLFSVYIQYYYANAASERRMHDSKLHITDTHHHTRHLHPHRRSELS